MSRPSLQISHMGSSLRSDMGGYDDADRESVVSRHRSRTLPELLTLLSPNDRSFDNLSDISGETSVVSCPFSEDVSPRLTEAVALTHFSAVHDEVMRSLKPELKAESVCSTCTSCDTCSTDTWDLLGVDEAKIARVQPRPLPSHVEQQILEKLRSVEVKVEKEKRQKSVTEVEEREPRRNSMKIRRQSEERPDLMAGLWNMLATYEEFVVTPPGFNVYQQEKPHWLDQEPIPWEVREKAKRKCAKWLNHYCS